MQGFTEKSLVRMTGLGLRRLERAMEDLVSMGLVKVHPRSEKHEDGRYKGLAAIRTISMKFFDLIGLGSKVRKERKKASQRRHERFLQTASQKTFGLMAQSFKKAGTNPQRPPREAIDILRAMKMRYQGVQPI